MDIILGLDPGLADTGFGVVCARGNMIHHMVHGAISTKPDLPLDQRLHRIFTEVEAIIKEYQPQAASLESLFFARNATSAMPVAHARGVLMLACALHGIPVREYTPNEIKQAVLGSGKAEKRQVQAMVRVILGLADLPRPDHAADALAAAICHAHRRTFDQLTGTSRGLEA